MTYHNITDWDLQAYLDNELNWDEQKIILNALEVDPALRQKFNDYRKQKELLKLWWRDH